MSVSQSKREHRTMIQSNYTKLNVRCCCFFRIHTPVHGKVHQTTWNPLKKAFEWTWSLALSVVKIFSSGHQYPTCVFVVFLRIISISKSKREHCTILPSRLMTANANSEWFFKVDAPWGYGLPLRVFKMWRKWAKVGSERTCYAPRNFFLDPLDDV